MFNLTSNKLLAHTEYKKILWAQFTKGLEVTKYQLANKVGQNFLIDRK